MKRSLSGRGFNLAASCPRSFVMAAVAMTIVLSLGRARAEAPSAVSSLPGWKLVWQDEFDGKELDASKWSRCKRGNPDWKNTMSDAAELLKVGDGRLHLIGVENKDRSVDKAPFLTAGVNSKGKFAFKYGKVQIRARFKSAQGAWPALWMLGAESQWPANGEIDLMEHLNFDHKIYQTVHSEYTQKLLKEKKPQIPSKGRTAKINRDGWNTYGCEWDADKITLTVNGKPTLTYPRVPEKGEKQWPFRQPFYLLLTMQIGGGWVNGTGPTNPAHYPAGMEVDWVRVWKKK